MALLVATLCIGFCGFITFFIGNSMEIESLKEENERLAKQNVYLKGTITTRDALIQSMSNRIRSLELEKQIDTYNFSDDVVKAVKKAVFYSHPDKGGTEDDFIFCNKVYNELRRKGYH